MKLKVLFALLIVSLTACSARTFVPAQRLGDGQEWRMYPIAVDMNRDGKVDIVATHRRPLSDNSLSVFEGAGDGTFKQAPQAWASPGYSGLGVGDVNGDEKPDLVAASHFNRVHTYLSFEDGKFDRELVMPSFDGYVLAKLIDLDGNGTQELVLLGNEKAGVEIYEFDNGKSSSGSTKEGWVLKTSLMSGRIGRDLQIVDMNRDGRLDLVMSLAREGVVIFLQDEGGAWIPGPNTNFFSATNEFRSLAVADFNQDGFMDIALNGGFPGVLMPCGPDVYLSDGKDGWIPDSEGLHIFKRPAESLAVVDTDGDGTPEIIAGGNITGSIDEHAYGLFMFSRNRNGTWKAVSGSGLPQEGLARPYGIEQSDLNGDAVPDLVATHGAPNEGSGYVSVWLGQKSGQKTEG